MCVVWTQPPCSDVGVIAQAIESREDTTEMEMEKSLFIGPMVESADTPRSGIFAGAMKTKGHSQAVHGTWL
ncbi:hypothetical protein, partial [Sediminibacterium sp.]|uniref:hypothetical protein n=1 Tax=Sediminibacterium sp. TaxID=1917865 RepID=UPI003F72A135